MIQQYSQTKSRFVDPKAYPRPRTTQQDIIIKDEISSQNLYFFRPHLKIEIPYPLETVAAGFPSPAQDYNEKKIDLNEHLIHNPIATFILKVNSLSMKNAGIEIGDEILIDRSLDAEHGDVVLALINNEFTVKRFMHKRLSTGAYDIWLKAENPDFPDIHPHSEEQIMIWGVVTCILKKLK